ncbi:MAG TPA: hypothetical protein VLH94_01085 [Spirochaetia bacterium]|nr:hypothetical protein [Spirochaetia bacterium]
MIEKDRPSSVEYAKLKAEILQKVNDVGPMGEMESWERAFPEVTYWDIVPDRELEDVDMEMIEIKWDERTVEERVFYTAFQNRRGGMQVRYEVIVEDVMKMSHTVKEAEALWYMWLDGCFTGEELTEEALRDFVGLMTDEHRDRRDFVDDADIVDVKVVNIEVEVK